MRGEREGQSLSPTPVRTYWLNFHLPYRCHHSLACCSSGWPIPIEHGRAKTLEDEIAAGRVHSLQTPWLKPHPDASDEMAGTLAVGPSGRCVFLADPALKAGSRQPRAGSCGVYSHRPLSCVHFPYVCLIDQRGVHVTLSHYCPTAASLLFDHSGPIEIVEGPSPVRDVEIPEGLDARESLPPLASPARLMTFDEFSAWEREAIDDMGAKGAMSANGARSTDWRLFEFARASVPPPLSWPAIPVDMARHWSERVAPAWESMAPVINRYLAARLFASWQAYLGDGPPTILRGVAMAEAVLRVESVRQCVHTNRTLDASLLKEAIRQTDLLLVHYATAQS